MEKAQFSNLPYQAFEKVKRCRSTAIFPNLFDHSKNIQLHTPLTCGVEILYNCNSPQ
jgi:hypothetical protein